MKTSTQSRTVAATFLCMALSTSAAKYHFSASTGDDSRTSAQAGSEATPWRSLGKLSEVSLAPGDQVLLKSGDIWYESIRIKAKGSIALPIILSSYGSGTLPEIRGTVKLKGTLRGSIRSATVPDRAMVKAVFLDTFLVPVAKYPSQTGWLWASAMKTTAGLTAANLSADDWTGASIHLRARQWAYETRRLSSGTNGNFVFDDVTRFYTDSVGYCLSNHPLAFERSSLARTWYHHKRDSALYWRDLTGLDSTVDAVVLPTGIDLINSDYVTIRDIKITRFGKAGILIDGDGIRITNCDISNPGRAGIYAFGNNNKFDSNSIQRATNQGIYSKGNADTAFRNTIRKIGLLSDLGPDGLDTVNWGGQGIAFVGTNLVIRKNTIDSVAYSGIGFWAPNTIVDSNLVSNFCQTTEDGGGIYTHAGQYDRVASSGSTIRHNVVRDSKGSTWGWRGKRLIAYHGIYLDDASHHINILNNVVYRTSGGVFLHNSRNDTVRGNILFSNEVAQIRIQKDALVTGDPKENYVVGNQFGSFGGQLDTQMVAIAVEDPANFLMATFAQNYYCYDFSLSLECRYDGQTKWTHRRSIPLNALGPETQTNGSLEDSWPRWGVWPSAAGSIDSGSNCNTGRCEKINFTKGDQDTGNAHFSVATYPATTATSKWRLSFDAKAVGRASISSILRRLGGDYANLGQIPNIRLMNTWTNFSGVIQTREDVAKTRLDFDVRDADSSFWFDNVSLRSIPDAVYDTIPTSLLLIRIPNSDWKTYSYQAISPTGKPVSLPALTNRVWAIPGGNQLTNFNFPILQGVIVYPLDQIATSPSVSEKEKLAQLYATPTATGWQLGGLTGTSWVIDPQGRILARLVPDVAGNANWIAPRSIGRVWLRSGNRTLSLIRVR